MATGTTPLVEADPEIYQLIQEEKTRQKHALELIASENYTSRAVMEALGSCLTNKYSEGYPGQRYYGGNQVIDKVEELCRKRALETFHLDPEKWGVNVQPYSGSTANFCAYTALLRPHDRIMGLDLPSGGHLTHGYQTDKKKISSTSIFFESMPYQVSKSNGLIDYDRLDENAALFRPQLIVCGASAYPREWDYARLRATADRHGAMLLCDMAHISGLVAAAQAVNPFQYADVVTTTTHKTLRGPRAGLIFFRKGKKLDANGNATDQVYDLEQRVNAAVFPGCQGGPHQNTIAAVAVALKEAQSAEFREYAVNVKKNAAALAQSLQKLGYSIVTGGTDNHLLLWDVRPQAITGNKMEKLLEYVSISVNKNAIYGDTSALAPGGVRLGTPSLTTRGLGPADMDVVAGFLHTAMQIALAIQASSGKLLKDFVAAFDGNQQLKELREQVVQFADRWPMPGL
jgi:glycine hydroxymethyltransferase